MVSIQLNQNPAWLGALLVAVTSACGSSSIPLKTLRAAPAQLTIDGAHITIKAGAWRDFMPPSPSDGKPMRVSITVKNTTGAFPVHLVLDRVWVVSRDDVWEREFAPPRQAAPSSDRITGLADGGPKWSTGQAVDVVVRLKSQKTDAGYLLRATGVEIDRTE